MTLSESTSSAGDIPASPSPSPAGAGDQTTPDTCGLLSPAPFAFYDLSGHFWRTSQATFLSDSEMSSVTWPRSGTTRTGRAYRRPPLVLLTSAGDSSSLPGPNSDGLWPTPVADGDRTTDYAQGGMSLGGAVRRWPTPETSDGTGGPVSKELGGKRPSGAKRAISLATAVKFYPTPTCEDSKNNGNPSRSDRNSMPLNGVVGGALNPTWVEWLMGFPTGWTDLEPSETP